MVIRMEGPVYDTGPGSLRAYAQILNGMLQSRDSGELFRRLAWADMNSPDHELSGYFGWGFGLSGCASGSPSVPIRFSERAR